MKKLTMQKKINIVGIGIIASILLFLVAYAVFARTLVITFFEDGNNIGLLFLVISLELITFLSSLFISLWQTDDLPDKLALKIAGVSFGVNLIVLCVLSYGTLLILYPEIFENLEFYEYPLVFPTVLLDFSIYVLGHPIYLFILSIIMYYLLFFIFIEYYYSKEAKKRV